MTKPSPPLPANLPAIARAPLPIVYKEAARALAACVKLDECKDWIDKTAALASYARQSRDEKLLNTALRIKGRATKRAGVLLQEYDARGVHKSVADGTSLSQREAAEQAGLSKRQQVDAVRVANVPEDQFEQMIERDDPATVTELAKAGTTPRPLVDIGDRDPVDFNRALHFKAIFRNHLRELSGADLDDILPRLVDADRDRLRDFMAQIEDFYSTLKERIGK